MSVNPGFGGQKFISNTYKKLTEIKALKRRYNTELLIEVDGGVDITSAAKLIDAGADVLVAGNAVFSAPDPTKYISELKNINPSSRS